MAPGFGDAEERGASHGFLRQARSFERAGRLFAVVVDTVARRESVQLGWRHDSPSSTLNASKSNALPTIDEEQGVPIVELAKRSDLNRRHVSRPVDEVREMSPARFCDLHRR